MNEDRSRSGKYRIAVICEVCRSASVYALRTPDQAVIRCETCGAHIFAYYTDPERRQRGETPSEFEQHQTVHRVEQELLAQVAAPARGLYEFLKRYRRHYGYAPTLREMCISIGWGSVTTARHHLAALERVGLIERDYGASRGIRLVYDA
ncbi:MAG: hypothetical protein Kow00124_24390 [Anaerolineae bacterium]